jgi:hypothetical protein
LKRGFVRKAIVVLAVCAVLVQGRESVSFGPESFGPASVAPPLTWNAPDNPVFYDRPLLTRQYGFGMLTGLVAGALGFYIGNAFEGAIFGGDSHKGYLNFTGIRYDHWRGPFYGGATGLYVGSALTVYFVGEMDEEQGSLFWTLTGGAVTTVAAFALADAAGVQQERGLLPFLPLLALPPSGALVGYHVSRWFNDKKRRELTEEPRSSGLMIHPPRLGMVPARDGGMAMRLDALNLTF